MAVEKIREHLATIEDGEFFCTRDMLQYGSRSAVDNALSRMNANHEITRACYGLYLKGDCRNKMPSINEIVRAKAEAFHREIVRVSRAMAEALGFPIDEETSGYFATNGRSSGFWTCHGRVKLVGTALRKVVLGDSPVGVQLRTLWKIGKHCIEQKHVERVSKHWTEAQKDECAARTRQLPQWLTEALGLPQQRPGAARFRIP